MPYDRTVIKVWIDKAINKIYFSLKPINFCILLMTFSWLLAFFTSVENIFQKKSYYQFQHQATSDSFQS